MLPLAAAGCCRLPQSDPDHEIQDFDHFWFEKLKVCLSILFPLQFYEEFLKVTSILTAFLQGFLPVTGVSGSLHGVKLMG